MGKARLSPLPISDQKECGGHSAERTWLARGFGGTNADDIAKRAGVEDQWSGENHDAGRSQNQPAPTKRDPQIGAEGDEVAAPAGQR